ncbi:competence type IV pilus ATPase ComGA [Lactobacillus sp. PV012]|uniref:competence type IV pilus ATPase ComGA n=1 Tax=Lactobacillus sp. PV012 TaxID=2594494 RepID=UPI00223F0B53|nr:competence type IV pilus ATPase ComGA [Lactobacillus sp. PV012]QNQ82519.1 competence protein [Lactobacillus sp. PV012]
MEIAKIAESILLSACEKKVSDIFIVPYSNTYQLNFRLMSGISKFKEISLETGKELLNFFKFHSEMDIAEHRRPQVGSWIKKVGKQEIFLRFSSIGNFTDQESMVIRLIYPRHENNYFYSDQLEEMVKLAALRGMIITSGPTGSGKTSTMYEIARRLGKEKMVMTIEDPVEIWHPSFLQTQVNSAAGIFYPDLLKAALRHRPDILIIGEIRDKETARIAVNAALSGHLVLATVHAKSTFQTIARLKGLGISKPELENSLTAVSYQRLFPNRQGKLSCLIDIASQEELAISILESKDRQIQFNQWEKNLMNLRKRGEIDERTFSAFKNG